MVGDGDFVPNAVVCLVGIGCQELGIAYFFSDGIVQFYIIGCLYGISLLYADGLDRSKQQVTLLHSGCLGGGPRPLIGHDAPAYKSYAIIDIPKKGGMNKASILGFVAPDDRKIPISTLPREVTGFNGTVKRIDRSLKAEKLNLPKLPIIFYLISFSLYTALRFLPPYQCVYIIWSLL